MQQFAGSADKPSCILHSHFSAPLSCDSLFQISKELMNFYDSVYDRGALETVEEKKKAAAAVLKVFHETERKSVV